MSRLQKAFKERATKSKASGKFLPTAIAQKLEHKPSKGLKESYKRRKRI